MNLSLEAYDWWATQVPTQYRTLESKTLDSSYSESLKIFDNINDENVENSFEKYIKVRVLPRFFDVVTVARSSKSWAKGKILKRTNAMEFIRLL